MRRDKPRPIANPDCWRYGAFFLDRPGARLRAAASVRFLSGVWFRRDGGFVWCVKLLRTYFPLYGIGQLEFDTLR